MSLNPSRSIREQRYKCDVDILHDIVIPDIHYDGIIHNLSGGGIYFESNEQILPDDEISVTVRRLNKEEITFDVYIIWRKDLVNSSFRFGYGAKSINPKESIVQICDQEINRKNETEGERKYKRIIYDNQIRLKYQNQKFPGRIRDISRGGAFIETNLIFPIGKNIILIIPVEKACKNVRLRGWIVRRNNIGFGIKFI